ncbi:MAG: DUF99 family protein [Candidatus Micrarchaeota archaeon]|nr:DUF99 family protein [Candidatus Micrarchaeota archaeon]
MEEKIKNIRVLAIDDTPSFHSSSLIFGFVYRKEIIEGALCTNVKYDGSDSTEKIIKMVKESRFSRQIKLIILNGITVAGLNIVDIKDLSSTLSVPVIAITRKRPKRDELEKAVMKLKISEEDKRKKLLAIRKAGKPFKISKNPVLYAQLAGIDRIHAAKIVNELGLDGLRLAHIVCSAIFSGESKGRF